MASNTARGTVSIIFGVIGTIIGVSAIWQSYRTWKIWNLPGISHQTSESQSSQTIQQDSDLLCTDLEGRENLNAALWTGEVFEHDSVLAKSYSDYREENQSLGNE